MKMSHSNDRPARGFISSHKRSFWNAYIELIATAIAILVIASVILFGCVVPDAPPAEYPGTDVCYQTEAYMAYCETDFYYAPGYWVPAKYGHVWVRGHYLPRPGHRGFHGRGGVHEVHGPRGHR